MLSGVEKLKISSCKQISGSHNSEFSLSVFPDRQIQIILYTPMNKRLQETGNIFPHLWDWNFFSRGKGQTETYLFKRILLIKVTFL